MTSFDEGIEAGGSVEVDKGGEDFSQMPCGMPQWRGGSQREPDGGKSVSVQVPEGFEGGCSGERCGDVVHEVDVGNLEETTAKSETAGGMRQLVRARNHLFAVILYMIGCFCSPAGGRGEFD